MTKNIILTILLLSVVTFGTTSEAFAWHEELNVTKSDVDIEYDHTTGDFTITWDFDLEDSDDIVGCYQYTNFYWSNYISYPPPVYDWDKEDIFHFIGYNNLDISEGKIDWSIFTRDDTGEIDCKGSMTLNIYDVPDSEWEDEYFGDMRFHILTKSGGLYAEITRIMFVVTDLVETTWVIGCSNFDVDGFPHNNQRLQTYGTKIIHNLDLDSYAGTCDDDYLDHNIPNFTMRKNVLLNNLVPPLDDGDKKGSNSCNDCTPPTIGVDKDGTRFVDNGLTLNGIPFNAEYFFTHMPMQYTEIGKTNHAIIKIYENGGAYNIQMAQFAMGVKEIGTPINEAQAILEIDIANFANDIENAGLDGVNLVDFDDIIKNYKIDVSLTDCMDVSPSPECLKLDIYWTYDKVPDGTVLAINSWDNKRNTIMDYFNDGLFTVNPNPIIEEVEESYKYVCSDPPLSEINVPTRNNCHFRALTSLWSN